MGFSYTSQKPTVAVPDDEVGSGFDRYTIRLNSEHTLIKLKDLDLLKVGETMTMVYPIRRGLTKRPVKRRGTILEMLLKQVLCSQHMTKLPESLQIR